jgi:hypothetical protein
VLNLDTYVFVRAVAGTLSEGEIDVLAGEAWRDRDMSASRVVPVALRY